MDSSSVIFGVSVLLIAIGGGGHCHTIAYHPGISYSWIIPPQSQSAFQSSPAHQDRPSATFDPRNESPITHIGGYGHPPFYLRHSHEQLNLPNEFLVTASDPQRDGDGGGRGMSPIMPLFQQPDPNKLLMNQVDCDGGPTCPNVDIAQQQRPTTIHQINIAAAPAITPPDYHHQRSSPPASLGQPVSWPSSYVGGIGLLFFVPDSASHLPVEQLIRQQLALHRTQFPFDISINCEHAVGSGCRSPDGGGRSLHLPRPPSALPTTTLNGWDSENGNYASLPLAEIVNSSSSTRQQRKWRTIGERLVRNKQDQNRLQQQQQQLQQNQRELSILPQ